MSQPEIENAKICRVQLGYEDHGILTSFIHVKGEGWGQGFGGRGLSGKYMAEWVEHVLKTLEVDDWSDLLGTICRVERTDGMLTGLGHFLKDQWFRPAEIWDDVAR